MQEKRTDPFRASQKTPAFPRLLAAIVCVAMLIYGLALTPHLAKREKVRNIAAQLNAALPPNEPLYAVDPDYQPALFYAREGKHAPSRFAVRRRNASGMC